MAQKRAQREYLEGTFALCIATCLLVDRLVLFVPEVKSFGKGSTTARAQYNRNILVNVSLGTLGTLYSERPKAHASHRPERHRAYGRCSDV